MPLIEYKSKKFKPESMNIIYTANEIIDEYQDQGFSLTLRQLYYQFVARDYIPNTMRSYKRLGSIINDGRMAGLIDWEAIEDRTRNMKENGHWTNPASMLRTCELAFAIDKWKRQKYAPEVWIEKEALVGVIEPVCNKLDIPYFACRGYVSQSEQWAASRRFLQAAEDGRVPIIFHLGDHDPSGVDMTRDNNDRLNLFVETDGVEMGYEVEEFAHVEVDRLALNMDQIRHYNPPPNPAKITDSRAKGYIRTYGRNSWELDALEPKVIETLIREAVEDIRDEKKWQESLDEEERGKKLFTNFIEQAEAEE